jgi:hypothetical protein
MILLVNLTLMMDFLDACKFVSSFLFRSLRF